MLAVFFQLMAFSQPVIIGTGTSTSSNSPWNAFYGYSYVQTIYLATEINSTGSITSVQFYYAGTAIDFSDSISMYMGITSKSTFTTTSDWEPLANLTPVFSGLVTGYTTLPGLVTITLPTAFPYNGSGNILIAVDENKNGNNGGTRFQGTPLAATTPNRVLAYSSDVTNPDPAAPPTGTRSSTIGNIIINGLSTASCQPASSLTVSGITLTGATASWSAPTSGNPVNTYNYEVRTSGAAGSGSTGLTTSGNSATTTTNITGLAPSTFYTLYLRPDCGSGNTGSWISTTFTTQCNILTDFSQNFDAIIPPALPPCWRKVGTQGLTNTQTTSPNSNPNTLYLYGGSATTQGIVSMPPVSNAGANNHQLKFSMRANFTVGGIIQIGYLTNPADSSTFVPLRNDTANSLAYVNYNFIPTGVTGASVVFAFRHIGVPAYSVLIDDVSWEAFSNCGEPTTLIKSNITATTAKLDWTAPTVGTPASYQVYSSTSSVAPTGTTTPTASGITTTTYNFTGLTPATKYYVWVRSNCGTGGVSNWSVKDSLTTLLLCNVPTALVHTSVTINSAQLSWTAPTPAPAAYQLYYNTNSTTPTGTTTPSVSGVTATTSNITGLTAATKYYVWVRSDCGSSTVSNWSVVDSFTTLTAGCSAVSTFSENFDAVTVPALPSCWSRVGLGGVGVRTQTTNPASTPNTVYIYSSTTTSLAVLAMPPVTNASTSTNWLRFDARGNLTAGGNIEVGYLTNPADSSTFVSLDTVNIATLTYQNYSVVTGAISGTSITLAFRHTGTPATSVLIDNVIWEAAPTCFSPTKLNHALVTTNSAQMSWTAPLPAPASYDLYYSTSNTAPTATTTPSATGITVTNKSLSGLTAATQYFVWVRSNCGTGGLSTWSVADSFNTQCNATNIPYVQDFETAVVPNMPSCTSTQNAGTGNNWVTASAPGNGFTTKTLRYGYNTLNAANAWFYTQGLNLTAGTVYKLVFNYGNNDITYYESLSANYGTMADASSMTNLIVKYDTIRTAALATSTNTFTPTTSGIYYIGFHAYSPADQFNLYLDSIVVDVAPVVVCNVPLAVTHANVTTTSADINWTAPTPTPASYELYYTTSNTAPTSTTTPTATGIVTTTYSLTGLTPSTWYYSWVRSNCGINGVSVWSVVDSFRTADLICNEPTALTHANVTASSADMSWSAASPAPLSYQLYYNTISTAPTSSTIPSVTGITTTTTNLTGLTAATKYYVWVRSNCGSGSFSPWSIVDSFTTLSAGCAAVATFIENFDAVTIPALPTCWARVGLGGVGVRTQTASPASSPNTVYIYSSISTSLAVMAMRPVTSASTNTNWLRFDARGNVTAGGNIEVGYLTNPADSSTFVSLQTVNIGTLTYQNYTVIPGPIAGSDITLAFRHTGTPSFSVLIDNVTWETVPSCTPPTALVHSGITTTGAQMDWTAPALGSPASYDLYYSTSNVAPTSTTTPSTSGITSTTATLTGLSGSAQYFVWVRSNCGANGYSTWSTPDSFYTQCGASNIPYLQNFELATIPNMPPCTSTENVGNGNNWVTVANPGNGFTSKTLKYGYNAANAANAWFYTQGLNLTGGTSYRLTFKYGNNSATYIESMNVSYGTSAAAVDMTNPIVDYPSITAINVTPATSVTDFTPATTGVYYIGYHVYSIANQFNLFVDDISVDLTPSCSAPTAVTHSGVTATSAQIDWTAPTAGTPASYELYYSSTNTAPTSTTNPNALGIISTTYNLTSLTPSTQYFVWVRSNCGAGGVSTWSFADSFYTNCVATAAFNENFDGVTAPALPNCWSKILRGATLSTFATVQTLVGTANSTPNSLQMYNSNSGISDDIILVSPALSNLSAGTYQFTFYARTGTLGENLEVGTLDNNSATATFTPLQTITTLTTNYQKFIVSFATYAGTDVHIGIRRAATTTFTYVYLDNIVWELIPTCAEPSGVTASSITAIDAQIDWTAPTSGSPASYEIYYSTNPTPPTGTTTPMIVGITGTTATITGLSASSTYCVWVRSNCGAGGVSAWSASACFNTACGVITAPTSAPETFATQVPPSTCWSRAQGILGTPTTFTSTTTSGWTLDDFTNRTTPVNKSAKLNIYGTARKEWLITPIYDLGTGGNFKLEFDLGFTTWNDTTANVLGSDDKFAVILSTDNGATWSQANALRIWDTTTAISSTGEHVVIDLSTYTGTVMFGFYGESTVTANGDNDVFVDNMEVVLRPVPVTLSSFKGERQGNKNLLTWTTATEQNNKGYELQRSANGENFSTIAFVSSKAINGTSNTTLAYNYADEKPFSGNNYYRLKQVDFDGRSTLSNVVLIKGTKVNSIVLSSVYPNPAKNQLNIVLSAPANDRVTMIITDVAGKVVMQQSAQLVSGDNNLKINVSGLLSGTYLIKAVCNNGCETAVGKFVKE